MNEQQNVDNKGEDGSLNLFINTFSNSIGSPIPHEEIMSGDHTGKHVWMDMEIKRNFENYHLAQNVNGGSVEENPEGFWGGNSVLEQFHYDNMNLNGIPKENEHHQAPLSIWDLVYEDTSE